jgi:hypothetical protein
MMLPEYSFAEITGLKDHLWKYGFGEIILF